MPNFDELIKELKKDIDDFGNAYLFAFFKNIDGKLILVDYNFLISDSPIVCENFNPIEEIAMIMNAETVLKILEIQKDIFR